MTTELVSLGILFFCAIIGGIIAARLKQPAVFGLLLVGALIGPHAFNLVKDITMIHMMADFGAILILFVIGLEFDLSKLVKLGIRPVLIGMLKFGIILFMGYNTSLLFGFSSTTALFIGVILSFSSTVVIIKVLAQKEMLNRKEVPLLIAILIIEDILAVLALTFFSGIQNQKVGILTTFEHILFSIAILVVVYIIALKLLKHATRIILTNSKDDSVITFLSLGMGVLFSYFASYLGLTASAGAFLAGSLIASLPNAKDYRNAIHPYASIFTSIFFISMGTLIDYKAVTANMFIIEGLIVITIISRFVAMGLLTALFANFKNDEPIFSSIAMLPIGEFSLLVAIESKKFGIPLDLVSITAAIIFISAIIMPLLINYSDPIHLAVKKRVSMKIRLKMGMASTYMRRFFDALETETFYTKKLYRESKHTFKILILTIAAFFIIRRLALLAKLIHPTATYLVYIIGACGVFYLLMLLIKCFKLVHASACVVLTNVDYSRNLRKCTHVINNLMLGMACLLLMMITPFILLVFKATPYTYFIPLLFALCSFYFFRSLFTLIQLHTPREVINGYASSA